MRKSIIFLIFTIMVMSLSAVYAADNATDIDMDDAEGDAVLSGVSPQKISANESSDENPKAESEIHANSASGYEKFSTKFTMTLTSNGTAMPSKDVIISVNGKNYTKTTDSSGKASLSVNLKKGTYRANCYFLGDNDTSSSAGSALITIKSPTKTVLKVADKDISYRQGLKSVFSVRLLKSSGAGIAKQKITFKVNGKKYTRTTSSKGYAQIFLKLNKGKHKISYSFKAKSPYLASSGSTKVSVKPLMSKGNGYWMQSTEMYSTNLKLLKSKGTKNIFLNYHAIDRFGKNAVSSWIKKANGYGIKVHIWEQIFFDDGWIKPIKADGSPNYSMMKKKVSKIVDHARISGVSGIHFDYVRFGGNAMNYDNSVKAVNYFVKKACVEIRKVNSNCIISAAVMPEPGMTEYYYAQDIPTITKYLDAIIPMAYKGNYGKKTSWIEYVTKAFVMESNGAQVWTGIQSYKSESNPKLLSASELLKDAKSAKNGGAKGTVLFRLGFTKLLNFKKV